MRPWAPAHPEIPPRPASRIGVLASGSGTILEAIIAAGLPVRLVVADRPCRALDVADAAGVPAVLVDRSGFGGFGPDFDRDRLHRGA